jgi:hypothetical protein
MFNLAAAASAILDAPKDSISQLQMFLWGAGGSFALEIISLHNEIRAERATGLPGYYKNPVFWTVRLAVTAVAGGLAVAENAGSAFIAINIGASAPAILQLLTTPPKTPPEGHK